MTLTSGGEGDVAAGRVKDEPDYRPREEAIGRPLTLPLTDTAESDLAEIWSYVAGEASEAATRLIDKVKNACEPLRRFPGSAPSREEFGYDLLADSQSMISSLGMARPLGPSISYNSARCR